MSTGTRYPLDFARKVAARVCNLWGLNEGCTIAGSIRREKPDVGDIELVAPLPAGSTAGVARDTLFQRIAATVMGVGEEGGLFGGMTPGCVGRAIEGVKPFFKHAKVSIDLANPDPVAAMPTWEGGGAIQVDLWRYEPGLAGNRGWVEVVRTGSQEFGTAVLSYWKYINGIPADRKGSDGHLLNSAGWPVATPTEAGLFAEMRLLWVPPRLRTSENVLCSPEWRGVTGGWKREKLLAGMRTLEIKDVSELDARWEETQRLAKAARVF